MNRTDERDSEKEMDALLLGWETRLRVFFQSPYDQYKERNGQCFNVSRVIRQADADHDWEVLPMFVIQFPDAEEIEAWPEEILRY